MVELTTSELDDDRARGRLRGTCCSGASTLNGTWQPVRTSDPAKPITLDDVDVGDFDRAKLSRCRSGGAGGLTMSVAYGTTTPTYRPNAVQPPRPCRRRSADPRLPSAVLDAGPRLPRRPGPGDRLLRSSSLAHALDVHDDVLRRASTAGCVDAPARSRGPWRRRSSTRTSARRCSSGPSRRRQVALLRRPRRRRGPVVRIPELPPMEPGPRTRSRRLIPDPGDPYPLEIYLGGFDPANGQVF